MTAGPLSLNNLPDASNAEENISNSQAWWHKPVGLAFGKLRQEDGPEYKASLGYTVNSRIA